MVLVEDDVVKHQGMVDFHKRTLIGTFTFTGRNLYRTYTSRLVYSISLSQLFVIS